MINIYFSDDEISPIIDFGDTFKSNETPGLDSIPTEFIKYCKDIIARDIITSVNYITE